MTATADQPGPTGTVAFLFTDIEGSTKLWEQSPQAMAMALRGHDEVVRQAVAANDGHVFSTGGDGFAVAFPTVADAVRAAVAVQQGLQGSAGDGATALAVRMGLHAGAAVERDGDYFGPVVNRAARIMAAAHGGQILISGVAARLLGSEVAGLELRELGTHRLRDLVTPEAIVQVSAAELRREFPPLRSRRAGNIGAAPPLWLGRTRELDEIIAALAASRTVTVVSGAPRSARAISLAAARSVGDRFPLGTWYLDCSTMHGGAELGWSLANVLGVADDPDDPVGIDESSPDDVMDRVAEALEGGPALLVLDGASPDRVATNAVAALVDRLGSVSVLVTSPSALGLAGERLVTVQPRSLPADLERFRSAPMAERDEELDRLRGEYEQASAGVRRQVMVSGEEGIGKSRLVAELAAEIMADDGLVLRGAWDEEAVTDFQAFREAFARHYEGGDRVGLRDRFGDLLPVLDVFVPGGSGERVGTNDVDRYRLLDALDSWLAQVASVQPVLLWLDDLQWADPSSLQMLQHLARSPRAAALVIVATYQPSEVTRNAELAHTLAQLQRSPGFEHIELAGLSPRASLALISRFGRTPLGPRSSILLHQWSGGNPYFLLELTRMIDESTSAERDSEPRSVADLEELGAPSSISDVFRWRLDRRSPRLAEALTLAAVLGTVFDAPTLAAVLGTDLDEVEDLLDEAIDSGFVDAVPGAPDLYGFKIDLVRQALYQALRAHQRVRLHRRVLEVLLQDPDPDPAAVARHLSVAAGPDDLDRTVEFATAAARRAADQMAFENAARHYDQALRVLERYPEVDGPRIELLIAAGQAHNRAGALGAGREHLERALQEAQRRNRPDLIASAALSWGGVLPSSPPMDAEAVAWLQVVVDAFGSDTPERARALARQAELLHRDTNYAQRQALVDEALTIARGLDDPGLLASVLTSSGLAMLGPGDGDRLPAVAEQIIDLSNQAQDDELAFNGWKLLLQGLLASGRMDETRDVVTTVRRLGQRLRQPEYLRIAVMWDAALANLEGRFADARRRVDEALTITLTGDHSQVSEIQLMLRLPGYGLRGTSPALRVALEEVGLEVVRPFRAWFHAEAGELDRAAALLPPDLVDDIAERRWYLFWGQVVGFSAAVQRLGDTERARGLRELITPYRDDNAWLGLAAFLGSAAHHRGVLSGVLGQWDEAVVDLEAGLERHQAMGARPWLALSQIELARVLQARGGGGDAARAAALRAEAVAVADELGLGAVRWRAGQPIAG